MSVTFRCEYCHKEVKAPDAAGGKRGKCPYCGQSTYVPSPVSEEDVLPLEPVDESEERRRRSEEEALREQEQALIAEMGGAEPQVPLEQREDLTPDALYHLVVNYCLDMAGGQLDRAATHAEKLKQFRYTGVQAVEDFQTQKAIEPALKSIPRRVLDGFLKQLHKELT